MSDTLNQAEANYDAYLALHKDRLENERPGAVALMHNEEIVDVYDDEDAAYKHGCDAYGLGSFSLVRIGEKPHRRGRRLKVVA